MVVILQVLHDDVIVSTLSLTQLITRTNMSRCLDGIMYNSQCMLLKNTARNPNIVMQTRHLWMHTFNKNVLALAYANWTRVKIGHDV